MPALPETWMQGALPPDPDTMNEGEVEMEEFELLQQVFTHRMERLQEDEKQDPGRSGRASLKEKLKDPSVAEVVKKVRGVLQDISEVRMDRVAAVKKEIKAGTFPPDGKIIADRILQEAILDELL